MAKGKGVAKDNGKGKAVATKGSSGKRKRDDDKSGGRKKRTNPAVLQFFEDSAAEASDYDTSDFEEDFPDDDYEEVREQREPRKSQPHLVKEEEISGDELERVLEERYRSGSGYVKYAEDDFETKRVDKNFGVPSAQDPVIWKVKCKVGRERQTIFCLMQKFADLKALGTKLQIVSAFSVDHVRGFIFVEANKQFEVMEACKQLPDVYYSMITHVPNSEFSQMLAVRKRKTEVGKGMWVRVKSGNYKGDLAQVVGVGDSRKKATVKLIPRVDFQALAAKFGAGSSTKRAAIPKPRLIAPSDLEEFRPLMQSRRDRDTGMQFEVLDGLMLKDGYLYKKVSVDSLRLCDVNPSVEELQKFRTSNNEDSGNVEFLSQLYGDKKETPTLKPVQVGGKGEGTSGSKEPEDIEVHDLVLFGKREFGMVIGMEKDETYKILKYGLEGSAVVSLGKKDFKNLNLEKKFNALDHRMKTMYANDVVKVLDGPLKDKEGVVKQIYRGIIFLYDQNDMEDNAYFCAKAQSCEKVKHNDDICLGKDGEAGPSGCEDLPSSPKTPLSPEKPWQTEEQSRNFNRKEQEGDFSVGQSLRIRVGPLKGYLCRVLAVRRSDITVKLDSRQKVLTVKSEHLSEVRGKSFATSTCDDTGLDSSKPFDFLGNNAGGNDWMAGSAQNAERNEEGQSNEGSSWPAFTSSAPSLPWGAGSGDTSTPTAAEDDPWLKKPSTTLDGGSTWGQEVKVDIPSVPQNDTSSSWDKGENVVGGTGSWGNPPVTQKDASSSWDKGKNVIDGTSSWGNLSAEKDNGKEPSSSAGWGQQNSSENTGPASENAWDQSKNSQEKGTTPVQDSWGKTVGGTWGSKPAADSQSGGWGAGAGAASSQLDGNHWGKPNSSGGGASWSKSDSKQEDSSTKNEGWTVGKGSGEGTSEPAAGGWNSGSSGWGQQNSSEKDKGPADGKSTWDKVTGESQSKEAGGWGSAVDSWAKKSGSSEENQWKSSADASGVASGGWGSSSGKWGTPKEDNASTGNDTWGKSNSFGSNQGQGGGRGDYGGRRGRGRGDFRGGRDQAGRGRGGRQSWNSEGQDKPSWGRDQGGGGGWGASGGGSGGWGSSTGEKSATGGWGSSSGGEKGAEGGTGGGSSWGASTVEKAATGGGWGGSSSWGAKGSEGGSGGGSSSWSAKGSEGGSGGGSSSWGAKGSEGGSGGGSAWGASTGEKAATGGWGSSSGGGAKGGECGSGTGSGWGASTGEKAATGGWGSSSGGGAQGGEGGSGGASTGGGWGSSSGGTSTGGGWGSSSGGTGGGWGDSSGKWGSQKEENAYTGNDTWGQSNNSYGNNQGRGRGRGDFGGRRGRGRGDFRGGRDQSGRGRGGRQSWNSEGQDKPSWGRDQGGRGGGGGGGGGGGWGASSGGNGGWGSSTGDKATTGGWGASSGEKADTGGWGSSSGGATGGGSSSWGAKDSEVGSGGAGGSGSGWGKAKVEDAGGSGWGNSSKGEAGGGGGWGNSSSAGEDKAAGGGGWGGGGGGGSKDQGSGGGW